MSGKSSTGSMRYTVSISGQFSRTSCTLRTLRVSIILKNVLSLIALLMNSFREILNPESKKKYIYIYMNSDVIFYERYLHITHNWSPSLRTLLMLA